VSGEKHAVVAQVVESDEAGAAAKGLLELPLVHAEGNAETRPLPLGVVVGHLHFDEGAGVSPGLRLAVLRQVHLRRVLVFVLGK